MVNEPTVISTFAGCGESSLGYKLAGYRELLAVECDKNAVETFKLNFPEVSVYYGDISKLTGIECMRLAGDLKSGELDVLDGSPPCQGFSTAGKRKFNDSRNGLFREYSRLLSELQPKVFVFENVTGLIKGIMKHTYLQIIETLRGCGYKVRGEVMNAMYYNVPQSRERVIIIGIRNDIGIEPSHPKPQTEPISAWEAIDGACKDICGNPRGEIKKKIAKVKPGSSLAKTYKMTSLFSYVRCPLDKPCMTIPKSISYGGISVWHPTEERNLSIGEMKRIFSFPDSFDFGSSYEMAVNRMGNSVPPNLMRAIANHIKIEILDKCL